MSIPVGNRFSGTLRTSSGGTVEAGHDAEGASTTVDEPAAPGWVPKAKAAQGPVPVAALDEAFEQAMIGGPRQPSRLVTLAEGRADAPATLTIHGITGNPGDLKDFAEQAMSRGERVMTFCYDDQYRRLTDSSSELADQLAAQIAAHPDQPLVINAHSMGGRVALAGLAELERRGQLTVPVELRLIAPPLQGFFGANFAHLAPKAIGEHIGGVEPGKDMGTWSGFQRDLETTPMPKSVRTLLFTGGKDDLVKVDSGHFQKVLKQLGAEHIELPQAGHMTAIHQAMEWLDRRSH